MDNPETTLQEIITALRQDRSAVIPSLETESPTKFQECVLCRLAERSVRRALRDIFAEFVNDPPLRLRLRQSRGFCAAHVPLMSGSGEALGIAILCHDLAGETLRRWSENGSSRYDNQSEPSKSLSVTKASEGNANIGTVSFLSGLKRFISNFGRFSRSGELRVREPCPLCNVLLESEKRYVAALAAGLHRVEIWETLQSSGFLCIRHVENVAAKSQKEIAARLIISESERLKLLQNELEEFIRKNDYRFQHETMGTENDSWRRALTTLNS